MGDDRVHLDGNNDHELGVEHPLNAPSQMASDSGNSNKNDITSNSNPPPETTSETNALPNAIDQPSDEVESDAVFMEKRFTDEKSESASSPKNKFMDGVLMSESALDHGLAQI